MTNNPKKTDAFVYYGYELKVVDQVPIVAPEIAERRRYLDAKRDKLGHLLPNSSCCEPAPPLTRLIGARSNCRAPRELRTAPADSALRLDWLARTGIQCSPLFSSDQAAGLSSVTGTARPSFDEGTYMFTGSRKGPNRMIWRPTGNGDCTVSGFRTGHRRQCPDRRAQDARAGGQERQLQGSRPCSTRSANSYKALKTYSDKGEFVLALKVGGKVQKQVLPMKMTFTRPNKLDFDAGQVRITSDGTTMTTAVVPLKRYTTAPAPKTIGIDAFREGPIGAMIFGGPAGAPMFVLLNLLTSADPAAAIAQFGGTLQVAPAPAADAKAADPKAAGAKPRPRLS